MKFCRRLVLFGMLTIQYCLVWVTDLLVRRRVRLQEVVEVPVLVLVARRAPTATTMPTANYHPTGTFVHTSFRLCSGVSTLLLSSDRIAGLC